MEMTPQPEGGRRINLYSLVAYIPDPLASFLDRLRSELVPYCNLRAHVTILPPRPISVKAGAVPALLRSRLQMFSAFEVQLKEVEIFSLTSVVYLGVGAGSSKLREMHEALNIDGLQFREPFPYHPHVTLAQQIAPEQVEGIFELARRRWAEFPNTRCFQVATATFVEATTTGSWIDVAECAIGTVAPVSQQIR